MAKLTIRDLDVNGKRVFVRVDYNVPLEEKGGEMVVTDATRIEATLPTLRLLIEKGAKSVKVSATHPVFCGPAIERLSQAPVDEILVTDTIPLTAEGGSCPQIRQLSCAHLL